MKKKESSQFFWTIVASIAVSCFITFFLLQSKTFSPLGLTTYSQSATTPQEEIISDYEKKLYDQLYDVNFVLQQNPSGNINMYLPKITLISFETAKKLADQFDMAQNFQETDKYYQFKNEFGSLRVHKYDSTLFFESSHQNANTEEFSFVLSPDEQAIEIAETFIQSKIPNFTYEEAIVIKNYNSYQIEFINRLDNLKNYAFPAQVKLDQFGNIVSFYYSYTTYEKLDNIRIKSMAEAFYNLPIDLPDDLIVDLKHCTLVYHYENSIIQPAYLFEGETSEEQNFQCFVNATVFHK